MGRVLKTSAIWAAVITVGLWIYVAVGTSKNGPPGPFSGQVIGGTAILGVLLFGAIAGIRALAMLKRKTRQIVQAAVERKLR